MVSASVKSFSNLLVLSVALLLNFNKAQHTPDILDLNRICDNGEFKIDVDLGPETNWKCANGKTLVKELYLNSPEPSCDNSEHYDPIFKCMNEQLVYPEHPPLRGDYRPVAPHYGEYRYLPPQRWLHALKLGAVAFLYHPCTPKDQVALLRDLAQSCLWKHVITPYPDLPEDKPLALVSWGCIYRMEWVRPDSVRAWLRQNALKTDESSDTSVGTYNKSLITKSESSLPPHAVCPDEIAMPTSETTPTTPHKDPQPCSNTSTQNNGPLPQLCNHPTTIIVVDLPPDSHNRLTVLLALLVVVLLLAILLVMWRCWVSCGFRRRNKGRYKSVSKYFPVSLSEGGDGMAIPEMGIPKDGFADREKLIESDEDEL